MAPVCYIYDVHFRILVEDHELGAVKALCEMVEFLLEHHFYNVWRERRAPKSEYDVFVLQDVKDLANSPEDMMKSGPWTPAMLITPACPIVESSNIVMERRAHKNG